MKKGSAMITITLKKGREKPVKNGHPWIFSGSLDSVKGKGEPGEFCTVLSSSKEMLGTGYYNPVSSICVRMLSAGAKPFTEGDLLTSIDRAIGLRSRLSGAKDTTALRLVNAEGDFLPGLIVDKYDDGLCVQVLTAGMERLRDPIFSHLENTLKPRFLYERSDSDSRIREGMAKRSGLMSGNLSETVTFKENGLLFSIDIVGGQKTGFFLDQRDNRRLAGDYAAGAAVCDCFAYSGAFTVYAMARGARFSHAIDASKGALETARRNLELNGLILSEDHFFEEDVFLYLRRTETLYDLIILDPPKFARHPGEVPKAARGYKDINLLAFKKAAPNGVVFTFSCSGAIDPRLFRQIVFSAAADSGRKVQVLHTLCPGSDHPVNIAHPEGDYLKGLALRVL
jgi:23S rRNA (cytosine1962-C5)-methyltransferase